MMLSYHCEILSEALPSTVSLSEYLRKINKKIFISEEHETSKLEKPVILVSPLIPILIRHEDRENKKVNCNIVIWVKNRKL